MIAPLPEAVSFDRVAPLLDAILADVTAIQLKQLQMSATDANATNFDAVQQSVQVAASYNALDGLVNSENASLLKSNADLQVKTTAQISAALDQYQTALDSVNSAQQLVNTLSTQANANPTDQTVANNLKAANATLASATTNAATVATELTTLKAAQPTLSAPTFTSSSPAAGSSAAGGSTTPASKLLSNGITASAPVIAGAGGSGTGTPSLPPTKQMDTQVGLIWDRAMRILSTLGQPDSKKDWKFVLLRFYPSVTQADKKTQGIQLTYAVSCDLKDVEQPVVMDVYPRIAPVNILGEKLRDTSWNLAAVLGFPGTNATVNYNREHLKLTNSLGQSSFLTGFGAGTSRFGWTIGKTFGDETIAPGQREMYALIAVPQGCVTEQVHEDKSIWTQSHFRVHLADVTWLGSNGPLAILPSLLSDYYRFDYGPPAQMGTQLGYSQAATGSPAPLTFTLDKSIDPEARVLVNGMVLKRARDGFGQATVNGSKAGSTLFETTPGDFSATGSWTRISERQISLLLEPTTYRNELPLVSVSSPSGWFDLTDHLTSLQLNGIEVNAESLKGTLPGLLKPDSSTAHTGKALRWQADELPGEGDKILISLNSDVAAASGVSNQAETQTVSQTVTSAQTGFWGATPLVLARHGGSQEILNECESSGLLLQCRVNWDGREAKAAKWSEYLDKAWTLTVYDLDHGSGSTTTPVTAQLHLARPQTADRKPLFIRTVEPKFDDQTQFWEFKYPVVSRFDSELHIDLQRGNGNPTGIPVNHTCATGDCIVSFVVSPAQMYELSNEMNFQFRIGGAQLPPTEIDGLRSSVEPTLDAEPEDPKQLHGKNLCFRGTEVAFGMHGPPSKVECLDSSNMTITKIPKVDGTVTVYLLDNANRQARGDAAYHPIWISTAAGLVPWRYKPPPVEKKAVTKAAATKAAAAASAPATPAAKKPAVAPAAVPGYVIKQ